MERGLAPLLPPPSSLATPPAPPLPPPSAYAPPFPSSSPYARHFITKPLPSTPPQPTTFSVAHLGAPLGHGDSDCGAGDVATDLVCVRVCVRARACPCVNARMRACMRMGVHAGVGVHVGERESER